MKDFKVEPFMSAAQEAGASPTLSKDALPGKQQLLFEIPTRHLLKRTNVKLKKMLDLVLEHSFCAETLAANGLSSPEDASSIDKEGQKDSDMVGSDDFPDQSSISQTFKKQSMKESQPQDDEHQSDELLRHFQLLNDSMIFLFL